MALQHLDIQHVRNIEATSLDFDSALNVIIGPNASGKTSLLEAISLLAQGRSFRTPRIDRLIQHGQKGLLVLGLGSQGGKRVTIGLSREARKTQVKINGQHVSRSTDMIGLFPVHVITPESHELLEQGPKMRRQYLDWGVFHVKHTYLECWQRYHRVLRQRNSSLRKGARLGEIQAWDKPLAEEAGQLHEFRQAYLNSLKPALTHFGDMLLDCAPEFEYQPGWETDGSDYLTQLRENIDKDRDRGFTRLGPHRADLHMIISGRLVQNVFSRGQQKLLVCVMTLAQIQQQVEPGLILVDDLPAELDPERRGRLLQALRETGGQVFISATESGLIATQGWSSVKMFHVKHGQFQEVV